MQATRMVSTHIAGPSGAAIIAAFKASQVEFIVAVPDIWTSNGLLWPISCDPELRLVRLCKEDEGVSICSGLAYARKRAVLLMQYTGFLDSINAIRGAGVEYDQPVCMVVGLLNKEPDRRAADSSIYGVALTVKILEAMGVDYICIDDPADARATRARNRSRVCGESAVRRAHRTARRGMMRRDECLTALAALRGEAIVVGTYTSVFEWRRIAPSPLTLPATGAMGQGSSHALGIALGLPSARVFVLDGDGGLLMNLGTLVTIAHAAPANLFHFLCENGTYEANGSHPLPAQGRIDFAGLARAAGYGHVYAFDEIEHFRAELPAVLEQRGPVFVNLKLVPGPEPVEYGYAWMHAAATRATFQAALDSLRSRLTP